MRERLPTAAVRSLVARRWPGNVRELASVLESGADRAVGGTIGLDHLLPGIATSARRRPGELPPPQLGPTDILVQMEASEVSRVISSYGRARMRRRRRSRSLWAATSSAAS
ncbi:AAA-type ATPase lid domain-containing protein [Microbacterium xylanilyticum]